MKVVVLGSNSFSGSNFVKYLLEKTDYDVLGISRSEEPKDVFLPYKKLNSKRFTFYQMDLNKDLDKMFELFDEEKPEFIVNYASQSMVGQSWDNPDHWYRTNTLSIVKLTNWLKDKEFLKKYVHISTPEVYGSCSGSVTEEHVFNPSTPYAGSRAAADDFIQMLVKQFNFPAVFTRAANVYGECQQLFKIIPRSVIYMKLGKKIPLHGGGYARRSFIHISDVSDATFKIMKSAKPGSIYHLSTPNLIAIRDLVAIIADKIGYKFSEVIEDVDTRRGLDDAYILDSSKVKKDFGWEATTSIEEGLKEVVDWINENWDIISREPLDYIHKE